jgi:sigma-B regulation protein RsbU (phosphoserine phosphatase)
MRALPAHADIEKPHPPVDPHHVDGSALGQAMDLTSQWLLKQGDDPRYADPNFDDSGWLVIQAGRPLSSYGLKNVDRVWYRTHVFIPANTHNLELLLSRFYGSEAVFVNGVQVQTSGAFRPGGVNQVYQPIKIPIPDAVLGSGNLTIAVRASIGRISGNGTSPAGFERSTVLLLGTPSQIADASALYAFRAFSSNVLNIVLDVLLLLVALALALTLRSEREYLALFCWAAALAVQNALTLYLLEANATFTMALGFLVLIISLAEVLAQLEFVRMVLGISRTRLFIGYEMALAFTILVVDSWVNWAQAFGPGAGGGILIAAQALGVIIFFPFGVGLPLLALWTWWKRRNPDALLIFVPLLAESAYQYAGIGLFFLHALHLVKSADVGMTPIRSFEIAWNEVTSFIAAVTLLVFIVLRTLRIARARAEAASEIEAAKTVQQVLLARASQPTPGFTVESVYRPASQVGGDFFLVSPGPDGSLVAIVGDVSGKGLLAAMRVSMILGVLRREVSREPAEILHGLNEALLTQGEMGFTTACCVRMERSGVYSIANAGHISPYAGGEELATAPSLPLGLAGEQSYEVTQGALLAGKKMVLMSDGVVEARSEKGELYGFERVAPLTMKPAQEIADAAVSFGQEDDITVLTIACLA